MRESGRQSSCDPFHDTHPCWPIERLLADAEPLRRRADTSRLPLQGPLKGLVIYIVWKMMEIRPFRNDQHFHAELAT